jgi:uncharacterized protein with PIN domain
MPRTLLIDETLGRLAPWLRALGFDAARTHTTDLLRALHEARAAGRVLLTRNRRARERPDAIVVTEEILDRQLAELRAGALGREVPRLGARCMECNAVLAPLPRDAAAPRVPPYVHATQTAFHECPGCRRIYWRATHWAGIEARLQRTGWLERQPPPA